MCLVQISNTCGDSKRMVYVVPLCCSHASTPGILDIGSVIPVPKDI